MSRISRILSGAGLGLKKALGQNFLVNQGALQKIAKAALADERSLVLEIGCGLGNLTELLARDAARVCAVELDERFAPIHARELGALENVRFIYGDFLEMDLPALVAETPGLEVRVVGNIPYHITSSILFKLATSPVDIARVCLLMQSEVAERLAAQAGSKRYGILAAKARVRFEPRVLFRVSPGSFLPPPKVQSALACLTPREGGPLIADPERLEFFFRFVDAAFAQRRKIVGKSLAAASDGRIMREAADAALEKLGLAVEARAEELSTERLVELFDALGRPELPPVRRQFTP